MLSRKTHLLWDFEEALLLRSEGLVLPGVGTLPQTPQQSSILGAPFIVSPENLNEYRKYTDVGLSSSRQAAYDALRSDGATVLDGLNFGVDWTAYRGISNA